MPGKGTCAAQQTRLRVLLPVWAGTNKTSSHQQRLTWCQLSSRAGRTSQPRCTSALAAAPQARRSCAVGAGLRSKPESAAFAGAAADSSSFSSCMPWQARDLLLQSTAMLKQARKQQSFAQQRLGPLSAAVSMSVADQAAAACMIAPVSSPSSSHSLCVSSYHAAGHLGMRHSGSHQ